MRREERGTVQGPVKEQQPDGMSHRGVTVPPLSDLFLRPLPLHLTCLLLTLPLTVPLSPAVSLPLGRPLSWWLVVTQYFVIFQGVLTAGGGHPEGLPIASAAERVQHHRLLGS